jgi:prepilin-type processing-associated H-X9-DG protein
MDTWGWVADINNINAANPNELRCPSSPLRGPEKLNDLFGRDTTDARDGAPPARLAAGVCGSDNYKGVTGGAGATFGGTAASTPERSVLIAHAFIEEGFNTNYAAGWHLARGGPRYTFDDSVQPARILSVGTAGNEGLKGISTTTGGLRIKTLDQGPVHSSRVALVGDAAPGDINEAISASVFAIGSEAPVADPWAPLSGVNRTYINQGELLGEAMNDGPAFWNASVNRIGLIPQQGDLSDQADCESGGDCGPPLGPGGAPNGRTYYLQDTRDWFAIHGGGSQASCNILMADGSVRTFFDNNNDKFLNPGFPVPTNLTDQDYAEIGYRGPETELPPTEIFSGIFLQHLQKRSVFESN